MITALFNEKMLAKFKFNITKKDKIKCEELIVDPVQIEFTHTHFFVYRVIKRDSSLVHIHIK